MGVAGESAYGLRTRALIVVLWRAGLRISEALALGESDLDRDRGAILVRRGKAASDARSAWIGGRGNRSTLGSGSASPCVGALLCVVNGPTQGRPWSGAAFAKPFASSQSVPACVVASHRINFDTRTLSRWLAKACR
jgi:Phage integrase family